MLCGGELVCDGKTLDPKLLGFSCICSGCHSRGRGDAGGQLLLGSFWLESVMLCIRRRRKERSLHGRESLTLGPGAQRWGSPDLGRGLDSNGQGHEGLVLPFKSGPALGGGWASRSLPGRVAGVYDTRLVLTLTIVFSYVQEVLVFSTFFVCF